MTDPRFILGIHDGHNCGASLTRDGTVVASVCEERLTRQKNQVGYPHMAIDEVLRIGGISAAELTEVVYASLFMHAPQYLTDLRPWYRVGMAEQRSAEAKPKDYEQVIFERRKRERIVAVLDHLGVPADKVRFVEHHLAHLAAAYYTSPHRRVGKPVLGLTCDGAGDGLCATVSICHDNSIERIASTDRHASLGKIYSRITMLMGMTPWEHEYKVMGMAPYADWDRANAAAEPLRRLLTLRPDGLAFAQAGELSTNYCYRYLAEAFSEIRFDVIAGAVQLFTEETLLAWVRACIRHTGLTDVVCGGGVFMNVKANMLIAQLPEVTSLYVMPSAADESLSIGACLHRYYQLSGRTDHSDSVFRNLYLGAAFDSDDEERAVQSRPGDCPITVTRPADVNQAIADLLAAEEIVACCRGRMEWGARALGNRSILATAHDYNRVDEINSMIKQRDFWMPFAPSIRAESADRYIDDPKKLSPQFMTLAYPTTAKGYHDIIAASHRRDGTIRPQLVRREANPDYHAVLTYFEATTGRGALLNTSFNLHGEPIVNSPQDAIDVFMRSGLRHLAMNHLLISKTSVQR